MPDDATATPRPRTILVTGAASGIGAATCRALAKPGVALLIHTRRNAEGVAHIAAAARDAGAVAETMLADLAEPDAAAAVVSHAVSVFGGLDVLVSNAGFADRTPVASLDDAAFARSVDAIQWAFLRLARAALPHLSGARDARVVAVSSFVAHAFRTDIPLFPASAAAKAGLEALVRALARELGPAGVTVNAVVPGFIRKDAGAHAAIDPVAMQRQVAAIPLGRIGLPDDVAAAIAYLASSGAGYVTGQMLHVSGGMVI